MNHTINLFRSVLVRSGIFLSALAPLTQLPAATPFKLVVIGDTQKFAKVSRDGGPDIFTTQTEWIKENAVAENIAFVTHVGDVTEDDASMWAHADNAMSLIDGVVPYGVTFGNHDGGAPNVFAASRYQGYSWYAGGSSDSLAHAQTFTGAGITYLHINLPHSPNATHLTWAQGVIDAHPNKPTMISTHGYLADNGSGRSGNGNTIWNNLIEPNEQVFMTFCGHDWVPRHEIDSTTSGRKVMQIMVNWQEIVNGGNALLQMLTFDPDNSQISVKTYSPFLDRFQTDYSSEFAFSATFGASSVTINGELGPKHNFWNGAGANGNWQTAGNWGGTAPVAGEILEFKGSTRKVSNNDFPVATNFSGIVFSPGTFSNGYQFSGNALTLTGDIVNMGGYGPNIARTGPVINLPITLSGDRQINTGDWDMTVNGVLSGNGSLTKTHGRDYINGSYDGGVHIGDLYLTAVNTYTGNTSVTGGALVLDNNASSNLMPSSPSIELYFNTVLLTTGLQNGTLALADGQTLKGTGKVMGKTIVPSGASIAPGHARPGSLVQIGNISMNAGSSMSTRFGGTGAGEYDQLDVTGAVNLGAATLNLLSHEAFTPKVGETFSIVTNDGVDAVTGTFVSGAGSHLTAGVVLTEGSVVSTDFLGSGLSAKISYSGRTGNDVVLTVLPAPGSPVFSEDTMSQTGIQEGILYSGSIAGSALDGDNDPLVYSKLSGPAWLIVNPGGSLSGTPAVVSIGLNVFVVQVADPNGNTATATLNLSVVSQKLVGKWDFNNSTDLTAASIGSDLTLTGSDQAVAGIDAGDGAARIGAGSYYSCAHGIAANGGGSSVNEYTLVLDMSYPSSSNSKWRSIFQTSQNNGDDADCFIRNSNNSVGVSATGYSSWTFAPITWARITISVDNGTSYKIYADGVLINIGSVQSLDGRFALDPSVLFFADNNGEDQPIDVSSIRVYNQALSDQEIAALGDVYAEDSDNDGIADSLDSDDDNDGIPDTWETTHSLNSQFDDRNEDPDGDNYNNWQEYQSGTDPNSVNSAPELSIAFAAGSNPQLSFNTSTDRYYTVEYNDTLNSNTWGDLGLSFLGNGSEMLTLDDTSASRRFYRLRVNLP